MAADLEMENTSPPIFSSILFSDQLRDIDRAINKFDCPNEEISKKESHVINSQGMPSQPNGPQGEHNVILGPERSLGAYIAFERSGGATNTTDRPNSLARSK